jgi:hypothetical protein
MSLLKKVIISLILILIILEGIIIYNNNSFDNKVQSEINSLIQKTESSGIQIISEERIKKLPAPVRKYLKYSGALDKNQVKFARLKQTGEIRPEGDKWIRFNAEQYMSSAGFIWYAKIEPFSMIRARDMFLDGQGGMLIKFLTGFAIADAQGAEIDISSLLRLLSEMAVIPSLYLNENIRWNKINSDSAEIVLKNGNLNVSGVINFNDIGEIVSFTTDERYLFKNGRNVKERWTVKLSNYRDFSGFKVATKAEAIWNLLSGDLPYVYVDITDIEYDVYKIY